MSKKVKNHVDCGNGLVNYRDGVSWAMASEVTFDYVLVRQDGSNDGTYHYNTLEELEVAMKEIQPDMRKWYVKK